MQQNKIQTILLADDDEDDVFIFHEVIKEIDPSIKVVSVLDGVALMKMLESFTPDVLFLDIEMPCKNGLECLEEIHQQASLKNLFIVIYSANNRPADIETAYRLGTTLFLLKKTSMGQYKKAIASILDLDWKDHAGVKQKQLSGGRYVPFET